MPVLVHDDFALYETGAITRYLDRGFAGPALQPTEPHALARMDQLVSLADAYAYWPLVRQVFSHRVFRPRTGEPVDEAEVARGLAASAKVLAAVEALASGDEFLVGRALSLADLHLGAMIAYLVAAAEGRELVARHPRLAAWWQRFAARPSLALTDPGLPAT